MEVLDMMHVFAENLAALTRWVIAVLLLCGTAVPAAMATERVVLGEYFTNQY